MASNLVRLRSPTSLRWKLFFTYYTLILGWCLIKRTSAQFDLELRSSSLQHVCLKKTCNLKFCQQGQQECVIDQKLSLSTNALHLHTKIPFTGQFANVTLTLEVQSLNILAAAISTWTGRLSKEWQKLKPISLEFRLSCAVHFYGAQCSRHCISTSSNMKCDENTGQLRCQVGWKGVHCQEAIDCNRRCLHGKCSSSGDCVCSPGYEGANCSSRASTCNALKPCLNGGSCLNLKQGAYECRCAAGFDGPQCERRMTTCAYENPCQNGAECQQVFGQPLRCLCLPDYYGRFCQIYARNCSTLPCQNGAHCVTIGNDFGCVCRAGFVGKICDQKISKCTLNTCANGGICLENVEYTGGTECKCRPGFFGIYCEMIVADCRTSQCLNNGQCLNNMSSFHCQCPQGFTGNFCEIRIKSIELVGSNSLFIWILPLILSIICFALITISGIWLVHKRYRQWTLNYLDILFSSLWSHSNQQRHQPPKIRPPPLPQHSIPLADKPSGVSKTATEKKLRLLSADALCQNLYVAEPELEERALADYSTIDSVHKDSIKISDDWCQRLSEVQLNIETITYYSTIRDVNCQQSDDTESMMLAVLVPDCCQSDGNNTKTANGAKHQGSDVNLETQFAIEMNDNNSYTEITKQ